MTDLQVAIRKLSMYSAAHPIVPGIVASLTKQLQTLTGSYGAFSVGITKDEVLYDATPVASGNPVIRELARLLNQLNIAGVGFQVNLTEPHVQRFLELLAGSRGLATSAERESALEQYCRTAPAITLQFISFRGAVRDRDDSESGAELTGFQLWRGLVSRLTADGLPEQSRAALEAAAANPEDVERLASVIALISQHQKSGAGSYEQTIVKYLQHQSTDLPEKGTARATFNQEISRLFTNLPAEVRQQILRTSLEAGDGATTPVESFLDALPTPVMLEVLDQVRGAGRDVSLPTLSLLKKFVTLAESNDSLTVALRDKLPDHRDVLQDLLTKRANRTFYPSQYRALLDEDFSERAVSASGVARQETISLDEREIDHHLALILLETLEAPIRSQEQYRQTVLGLKDLLIHGIGEHTASVFSDALTILATRYGTGQDSERDFIQECIRDLAQREFLAHLLGSGEHGNDQRQRDALARMIQIVGPTMIPLLLDKLEDEENLKARKRLLTLLLDCGNAVVPLAVQRLGHAQWYVVRNMLSLLRDLRAVSAVPDIVRCLGHASSQVRLAAFQTLGALAPQTADFLNALKQALDDRDPKVFRAAVTHIVSSRDAGTLELAARLLLEDSRGSRGERQVAVLNAIGQAGNEELAPLLMRIQRRHLLRFWTWRKTRAVRMAANRALATIRTRGGAPHVGHQDAA
ncbi:MAG TPA: HEAT repeat domain-containing protein [Nitrospiria bacterium]|nr:HEAT repeat domain-containing protein [Nitrospiria bacterium]